MLLPSARARNARRLSTPASEARRVTLGPPPGWAGPDLRRDELRRSPWRTASCPDTAWSVARGPRPGGGRATHHEPGIDADVLGPERGPSIRANSRRPLPPPSPPAAGPPWSGSGSAARRERCRRTRRPTRRRAPAGRRPARRRWRRGRRCRWPRRARRPGFDGQRKPRGLVAARVRERAGHDVRMAESPAFAIASR